MPENPPEWLPSPRALAGITKRLSACSAEMTTAALADMGRKYDWVNQLEPEYRSWINVLVRSGVDSFVAWFAGGARDVDQANIFDAAPRPLQRQISLRQTVDLIRSTIDTVEREMQSLMPRGDRAVCSVAIMHYSREVAFDAAEVYARAAEVRGAWDARVEAMVMDAVVRGDADETVLSRASALSWGNPAGLCVVIGDLTGAKEGSLRRAAPRLDADVLLAPQGDRLVLLLGGAFTADADALRLAAQLAEWFGPGPVVVGPVVTRLTDAFRSARAALAGRRAATAWPSAPRPVLAADLLPERSLMGDGHARRALAEGVFVALREHGGDLLPTLEAFLDEGTIEATARRLFVHANTVRYRLARVEDVTGYSPGDSRDAYCLRLGLSLGRILG